MKAADGTPIVERPEAAIKSAARFARELARKSKHCEAAADCVHCNLYFLAKWAENMISDISRAEERERVLREALEKMRCNCSSLLPWTCIRCIALATPAPAQPAQPQPWGVAGSLRVLLDCPDCKRPWSEHVPHTSDPLLQNCPKQPSEQTGGQ